MGSTYLGRPCKPWLRTHRDTSRVNESPQEARESLSFIGACCVVNGSVRVRGMLDPNLGRTCLI